ncbi:MAG: hypothetical protein A3F42_07270 [Gammaproteobacteria bacterium RIFCSPHIGHO2_12_FULL_37_34]|nr:MAG: hypothetical protein A3F42_07270 [Gammaproteobacteria bacterium RIFCSPHIGHO2_12_FULL_37_34]
MKQRGFTLIEALVFIVVSGLLLSVLLLGSVTALRNAPNVHQQWLAMQLARQCMEWFIEQRRLNGYTTFSCPSTPSASACAAPSGFSVNTSVSCTTWNSDTHYKTITITVSGLANTSLSAQVGDY